MRVMAPLITVEVRMMTAMDPVVIDVAVNPIWTVVEKTHGKALVLLTLGVLFVEYYAFAEGSETTY